MFAVNANGEVAILRIGQIPDSRRAILETLKQRGYATISRLSAELGLTGEAIRQQLLQLREEGWVVLDSTEKSPIGRPASTYRLSAAGDHLFPKQYDAMVVSLLDAASSELGGSERILERLCEDVVRKREPAIRPLPIQQRVEALKNFYSEGDPYMTMENRPDGFALIERNCPYFNVALERPAFCSVSLNALERLTGVHVDRDESFQRGDGRCIFHVHANRPIAPDERGFKIEPSAKQ